MVHIDPIPTALADSSVAINSYQEHREGFLWYRNFADSTGLRLSAQTGGLYAEACIRQGDWADFADFMPGGDHPPRYSPALAREASESPMPWRSLDMDDWDDPDSVRVSHFDQIPWINQLWLRKRVSSARQSFLPRYDRCFRGYGFAALVSTPRALMPPYPNCFDMAEGDRGQDWLYRGPFKGEPADDPAGSYMKMSSVGGIIGYDPSARSRGHGVRHGALPEA